MYATIKPIITLKEVANYLDVSRMTIYRFIKKGKIPVSRVGNQYRFRKAKIDEWLDRQEKK